MKDKFTLKKVTIHIDQTLMERKKGLYYLQATEDTSPLSFQGKPYEIGEIFGKWLGNTIAAMDKNNCKLIKIDISWE